MSDVKPGEITVDEIMEKIREIVKKGKPNAVLEESSVHTRQIYNLIDKPRRETGFYLFAKKLGGIFKRFGLYGFVRNIKKLIPVRFKYKVFSMPDKFIKYHGEEPEGNVYGKKMKRGI